MSIASRLSAPSLTEKGALRVPEITAAFWIIKALSTAMGESTSDFLVHAIPAAAAVLLGGAGLVAALVIQFRKRRYSPPTYWLAVVMVGISGTMAADVLHVGFGVPYAASSVLYAVILAAVFISWQRVEGTLSIHSIDTPRREAFYWAAVMSTFAMGTALGDLTANTLHLGYFPSALVFAALILIPAVAHGVMKLNSIATFWAAYVITRPLGASLADGLGKDHAASGIGLGDGPVSAVLLAAIIGMVAYLTATGADVQADPVLDARRR